MGTPRRGGSRRTRGRAGAALLGLAVLGSLPAAADQELGPILASGELEFGGRLVWGDQDNAKFQEYRDLRNGLIGSFDLLLEDRDQMHWLRGRSENTGYKDQRYWLEGGRYGLYEIDLFYGELPHFFSNLSRTPYLQSATDVFVLPGPIPVDPATTPFRPLDVKLKWTEGSVAGEYHLGESTLLRAGYRIQNKQGNKAWGMVFGNPGGNFTTLPSLVDEQIHEVRAGTDWHRENTSFTVEYLGNFYENQLDAVVGDNPLVAAPAEPSRGRASTPPSNWAQSLLLSGSTQLPIEMPNRISASFAYGFRRQDETFLPYTINPTLANPALPQNSLDGQVQTLLGNLMATLRPAPDWDVELRYRAYDYDNLTNVITFPVHVQNDNSEVVEPRTSAPNDYFRQDADLQVDWGFAEGWTGGLGFGFEGWNRSADREVRDLYEYGPDASLDYRTPGGLFFHAGYEFRVRDGSTYNPFAPIEWGFGVPCPADPECTQAKLPAVRKFDEANRYLNRFDVLGRFTPREDLELTFTSDFGFADYPNSAFGLTQSLDWSAGADLFYQPHERVSLLAYYTYQWQDYEQNSRNRPVQGGVVIDTPAGNWQSQSRYQYNNAEVIARFTILPEILDAEIGYLVNAGKQSTHADGDGGAAVNYPSVNDLLQAATASVSWKFREDVTLRAGYRFEDYHIDDFHQDLIPPSLVAGNALYLGQVVNDYQANIFIMSATLRF